MPVWAGLGGSTPQCSTFPALIPIFFKGFQRFLLSRGLGLGLNTRSDPSVRILFDFFVYTGIKRQNYPDPALPKQFPPTPGHFPKPKSVLSSPGIILPLPNSHTKPINNRQTPRKAKPGSCSDFPKLPNREGFPRGKNSQGVFPGFNPPTEAESTLLERQEAKPRR